MNKKIEKYGFCNTILWFIPISSKIDKYQKIVDKKIENMVFVIQQ